MITGDRSKDREALEEIVWRDRPAAAFGYTTLPLYVDVVIAALLTIWGEEPLARPNFFSFWAFIRDMAPEAE